MSFTPVRVASNALSITDFQFANSPIEGKIGYVVHVKSGVTATDSQGFFTFKIKTVESEIVLASVFNLENFIKSGLDANSLKGKFVKISGLTSTFYNGRNVVLDSIEEVSLDQVPNMDKFIGIVPNLERIYQEVQATFSSWESQLNDGADPMHQVSFNFPAPFKANRFTTIRNGVVGGYVSFVHSWMCTSLVPLNEIDDWKLFVRVFYYSTIAYSQVLDRLDVINMITPAEAAEMVYQSRYAIPDWDDAAILIVGDVMSALLTGGSPQHLYAHVIVKAFNYVKQLDLLNSTWSTLPEGGVVPLSDGTLKRY